LSSERWISVHNTAIRIGETQDLDLVKQWAPEQMVGQAEMMREMAALLFQLPFHWVHLPHSGQVHNSKFHLYLPLVPGPSTGCLQIKKKFCEMRKNSAFIQKFVFTAMNDKIRIKMS
jgi:hypothetical protein